MTKINTDRIIGFCAPSRYAKTTGIANMIMNIRIPIIIYDTNFEWGTNPMLLTMQKAYKNIIVYEPDKSRVYDIDYLNEFLSRIRETATNIFIYIEDLEGFYNSGHNELRGTIKDLAERGGHSRIGLIYATKQLRYIPRSLIANTNLFYFGQFIELADIQEANGICKPDYDVKAIHRPQFIEVDRWDMSKRLVTFSKIF